MKQNCFKFVIILILALFFPASVSAQDCDELGDLFNQRREAVANLERVMTEGYEYIKQQEEITSLSSIRIPRINQAKEEVNNRIYIAQSAVDNIDRKIAVAQGECDAIAADRANQSSSTTENLESASSEVQKLQERLWQIDDEQSKLLWAEYERALENYKQCGTKYMSAKLKSCWRFMLLQ